VRLLPVPLATALLLTGVLAAGCTHDAKPAPVGPPSHRVVYTQTDGSGATSTVTVDVQRPYRARVVVTRDGVVMTETAWSEEGTYLGRDGEVLQTAVIAPGFPGPLAHLDIALPVALEQHLVRDLGTDQRVAGLTCHLWRSRDPLDGSAFAPAQGPDHTDSCVSSAGEVLSDAWYLGGSLVQRRVATQVTDGPSLEGAQLFDGRTPVPLAPNEVTASVTRSDAATLTRLLQLPQPSAPSGMSLDTASALLDLNAQHAVRRESAVLTYLSADRLAVLRLSRALEPGGQAAVHGAPVRVGSRTGRLLPVLAGLQLTLTGPRGLIATITTDLPRDALLSWAGGLSLGA